LTKTENFVINGTIVTEASFPVSNSLISLEITDDNYPNKEQKSNEKGEFFFADKVNQFNRQLLNGILTVKSKNFDTKTLKIQLKKESSF